MTQQYFLTVQTAGRGMINITSKVKEYVEQSEMKTGMCHLFLHHTSASLIICENSDHAVQRDMEAFMQRISPDGDPLFEHIEEGPDDMPSHVRTILTQSSLSIPVTHSQLALGTWQGIFLWEHRLLKHKRQVTVTLSP
jgi:secondary thiamine-phosphate synthase enzyme